MKKIFIILILTAGFFVNNITSQENSISVDSEQRIADIYNNLIFAITKNNLAEAKTIIEKHANFVNGSDGVQLADVRIPIIVATSLGFTEIVKYLIEKGAYINRISQESETPLELAKKMRNNEIINLLNNVSETPYQLNFEINSELNFIRTASSVDPEGIMACHFGFKSKLLKRIISIYKLNVYSYFSNGLCYPDLDLRLSYDSLPDLNALYDTPLKRLVFEKSEEYKEKLNKLKKLRKLLLKKEFFINVRKDNSFSIDGTGETFRSYYNITKKRFELVLAMNSSNYSSGENIYPLIALWCYSDRDDSYGLAFQKSFISINVKKRTLSYNKYHFFLYHYFTVPEEAALKIENNGVIKIFFKIKDIIKKKNNVFLLNALNNRIEITDKENGQIIYKRQF